MDFFLIASSAAPGAASSTDSFVHHVHFSVKTFDTKFSHPCLKLVDTLRLGATWPAYNKALTATNVPHEGYIYPDAVHGFNCDAPPERYNKAAADLAWQRTIDWLNKYVRG